MCCRCSSCCCLCRNSLPRFAAPLPASSRHPRLVLPSSSSRGSHTTCRMRWTACPWRCRTACARSSCTACPWRCSCTACPWRCYTGRCWRCRTACPWHCCTSACSWLCCDVACPWCCCCIACPWCCRTACPWCRCRAACPWHCRWAVAGLGWTPLQAACRWQGPHYGSPSPQLLLAVHHLPCPCCHVLHQSRPSVSTDLEGSRQGTYGRPYRTLHPKVPREEVGVGAQNW